jgi:cytochrome c553
MMTRFLQGSALPGRRAGLAVVFTLGLLAASGLVAEPSATLYLSDLARATPLVSRQAWGALGLDTAAAPADGRAATPIRIGEKTYAKGLGHHAGGEIVVPVSPAYVRFVAEVGVQWQGGKRGSVVMQVWVDGVKQFDSGVRSDSDATVPVEVSIAGARELRLVATDNGDGIGCDMATWAEARVLLDGKVPSFGPVTVEVGGLAATLSASSSGFAVATAGSGPQIAFLAPASAAIVAVAANEAARLAVPVNYGKPLQVRVVARLLDGAGAEVVLQCGETQSAKTLSGPEPTTLEMTVPAAPPGTLIALSTKGGAGDATVRWDSLSGRGEDGTAWRLPLQPVAPATAVPAMLPALRPGLEKQLLEWDWRLQDGIGTPRQPSTWQAATARVLERGLRQVEHLRRQSREVSPWAAQGEELRAEHGRLSALAETAESAWEDLWRRTHQWRRDLLLRGAWGDVGPLVFVKQVPSMFSHQLTQYYGSCARPGGGLCVLDAPGQSLNARVLAPEALPPGSFQHVDVSADGKRLLFAYCEAGTAPKDRESNLDRFYRLYEMGADGSGLRQLTAGAFDDFRPRYLPDGRILFLSTRRGGFHRCGRGPCAVYTLALAEADGSNPRPISFHETNEWDPVVTNDGRIVYTRWDYVDRSAVYYQQLWSVRPDGSDVRIFYGNNTYNPVGVWEAQPIPGSRLLMATAAAHHAMTAGSIIRLDPSVGVDGPDPITRLTPDVLFPESEVPVAPTGWRGSLGVTTPPALPEEQARWPGHCYRSPYPLSETLFLAAYSFEALIGEPSMNPANMFGLYLADAFGNRELLHRDLNVSSQWPVLLRARPEQARLPSLAEARAGMPEPSPAGEREGIFMVADAYEAYPALPEVRLRRLRVLQVLPKSTWHANSPPLGLANASPGKQVLGTVPIEADGSACFRAPAGVALAFQVLDEQGQAVQTMRSVTYLQPGEATGCVGCHEPRLQAPAPRANILAMGRPPAVIEPGPAGSNPLSFPLLVQPVLDRQCVRCHSGDKPKGDVVLTPEPEGPYTRAYMALAKRVPYSAWGSNAFYPNNAEPLAGPDHFGARASPLMKKLLAGHSEVKLTAEDVACLVTWMDANALFYGTFNPADQARQRKGELIAGPDLQ